MAQQSLHNYLRTYRKRAGLTQDEVAQLVGLSGGDKVSRYERRAQAPSLETLFAYEALFGVPASELMRGLYEKVERETGRRAASLHSTVVEGSTSNPSTDRKVGLLHEAARLAAIVVEDELDEEEEEEEEK